MMNYIANSLMMIMGKNMTMHSQRGATLVEYALIIALIGVGVFVAGTVITGNLTGFLDYVASLLPQS